MTELSRRTLLSAGAGAGATALAAPAVARAQQAYRWRMVTSWPPNLPGPGVSARRLAERIAALSDGRITVQVFSAGEIVPAFEVFDAVADGVADLAHTAALFWQGKAPAAAFYTSVPFGLTPGEHNAWVLYGGGQALWDRLYADFGLKPFMAGNTGMSMGGWFKRELSGPDDLRGLRFRMPGLGGEMYKALGVMQVSLPPGETLVALRLGTIDAAEFAGPASDLALGFHEGAQFYYWPGLHEPNGTGECLVNRALWEGLPADLQAVIRNACEAENAAALAEAEYRNQLALARLVGEHGVELRRFPRAIEEQARAAARDLLAGFGEEGGIAADIRQSYEDALERGRRWPSISVQAFLEARNRTGGG
jgi:TRAP-type mannitol/chloroaromatic compound transport system substrate-binding protein